MSDDKERGAINELIAEKVYGWKWMAWFGIPVRGTDGYPTKQMVRTFVSPKTLQHMLTDKHWKEHWKDHGFTLRDATGDEPLDYSYCSSSGYDCPPNVAGDWNDAIKLAIKCDYILDCKGQLIRVKYDGKTLARGTKPIVVANAFANQHNIDRRKAK